MGREILKKGKELREEKFRERERMVRREGRRERNDDINREREIAYRVETFVAPEG